MNGSLLQDAFAHHVWSTIVLIDACLTLSPQGRETVVPGTYGSIIETQRHVVGSDSWYLFVASGDRSLVIDEERMDLPELRAAMQRQGSARTRLLADDLDPDAALLEVDDDDGFERHHPMGIQLAQALHHGTDHRSQICTALTSLGVEPPGIDVWNFGLQNGRIVEAPPSS